jgi:hypothetical protein
MGRLGSNCGTCAHAIESDDNAVVVCDCEDSTRYEEVMSIELWCVHYEEA